MAVRLRPYGPTAWIVEGLDDAAAWADAVRIRGFEGVIDVVPAETSVVVRCASAADGALGDALATVVVGARTPEPPPNVVVDVVYDGADLPAVAAAAGLSIDAVIEAHERADYRVAFCGFSPGFGYLTGLDPRLHLPRLERPRTAVPAGSVAIAARYSAVYPSPSPGGWHLIGRTATRVWDAERHPPALLVPGSRVRFRSVS